MSRFTHFIAGACAFAGLLMAQPMQADTQDSILWQTPQGHYMSNFRSSRAWFNFWGSYIFYEDVADGVGDVVVDGNTYYFRNPFTKMRTDTWYKGTRVGNTILVETPQPIFRDENGKVYYLYRLSPSKKYSNYFEKDSLSSTTITFNVHGDSIIQTDGGMLGYANEKGEWYGYGDTEVKYALVDKDTVALPADAKVESYAMSYLQTDSTNDARITNVVFHGDSVYLSRLADNTPGWVVGKRTGNKVTFRSGQYLGPSTVAGGHLFFYGASASRQFDVLYTRWVTSYSPMDSVVFTLDEQTRTLAADSAFVIFKGRGTKHAYHSYNRPDFKPFVMRAATPTQPTVVKGVGTGDWSKGENYIQFKMSKFDTEGNFITPDSLYFTLYADDGDDVETYVFDKDAYTYLDKDTTSIIPFGYTDESSILFNNSVFKVYLYQEMNRVGVQSVYTINGVTNRSGIAWYSFTSTGIKPAATLKGKPVETHYYSIDGREVTQPGRGIYLKQVTAADGSKHTYKIIKK